MSIKLGRESGSAYVFGSLLLAAIVATTTVPATAQAPYPSKPVRMIVGFAAGGPTDIISRVIGAKMSETLGQQVVIENRGGAGGNLGTETAARSEPDGYTVLLSLLSSAVNESLFKGFKYRFADYFEPIGLMAETGLVLLVHPSLDVRSVSDLIAMAKAKPGDVLYASAGKGTATHLAAELFNATAGTKMTAVHYKGGGETIKDLLSGQMKVMFSTIPPVLGFVRDGTLRGIATTGPKRDPALPDLPTIAEAALPGYDVRLWFGMSVPKGTPRPVVQKLATALRQSLDAQDTKSKLAAAGYTTGPSSPEEFGAFYASEVAKWAKVVESVGSLGD
ncbi:MAG: tripartite tricarboxylate transporter substrate binding protein [Hyphomicrobiales bacterium]|nr:tripartite tricarboxylate transporter substrate binding protein [Hyphomicrobiales bacterium]